MTNATNEDKSELLFNEGNQLLEEKNYEEAEKKFKEASVLIPNSSEILYNLALAYFEQQKYDLALEIVNKLKGIDCDELIIELEKVGFKFTNHQKKRHDGFRIFIFIVIGFYLLSIIFALFSQPIPLHRIVNSFISVGICFFWLRFSHTRKPRRLFLCIPGGILFLFGSFWAGMYFSDLILRLFYGHSLWIVNEQYSLFQNITTPLIFLFILILSYFLCFGKKFK